MKNWLLRAISVTPVLITLALIVKVYLIVPNSVNVVEFEVQVEQIFRSEKGDREGI